jgi:hypothetical protein
LSGIRTKSKSGNHQFCIRRDCASKSAKLRLCDRTL